MSQPEPRFPRPTRDPLADLTSAQPHDRPPCADRGKSKPMQARWRATASGEAHAFAQGQRRPLCGGTGWDERWDWPTADRPRHDRCLELVDHISPVAPPDGRTPLHGISDRGGRSWMAEEE